MSSVASAQTILRVDNVNGSVTGDGSDWGSDAFLFLQDALDHANANQQFDFELWLAANFDNSTPPKPIPYTPDKRASLCGTGCEFGAGECNPPCGSGGTWERFTISPGANITIRGGFLGSETEPNERPAGLRSILSGDLHGDDEVTIEDNGVLVLDFDNYENNATRVVMVASSSNAVFDRVVIRGANGQAAVQVSGTVLMEDCIIEENIGIEGGGVRVFHGSLEARRCTIRHNKTVPAGGKVFGDEGGAGIAVREADEVAIISSRITRNLSHAQGGAMRTARWAPVTLVNTEITGNVAEDTGAEYLNSYSGDIRMWNCLIVGNATEQGGTARAIYSAVPYLEFINCTIADNLGDEEPGLSISDELHILNSIVRDNGDLSIAEIISTISFSNIEDCAGISPCDNGDGNIDADPLFVDAENGNYRLTAESPCVAAGESCRSPHRLRHCAGRGRLGRFRMFDFAGLPAWEHAGWRRETPDRPR